MKKTIMMLCLFVLTSPALAEQQANWRVVLAEDPLSGETGCLMISAEKVSDDGQTQTPVSLIYNGRAFIAQTHSNIDTSYANLGLRVDLRKPHNIDRLLKESSAVFENGADRLRDECIDGLTASLRLGFWPTWPKTHSYVTEFDLRGFTRSYQAFQRCQQSGELP
jgi:hypothetical protein